MLYEEFLTVVQERAKTKDTRETLIAIEATLKTLGERMSEADSARLASKLPLEIGLFLTVVDPNKDYNADSFYRHVAQRESLPLELSREHARAVLSVLRDALDPEALATAITWMPEDRV